MDYEPEQVMSMRVVNKPMTFTKQFELDQKKTDELRKLRNMQMLEGEQKSENQKQLEVLPEATKSDEHLTSNVYSYTHKRCTGSDDYKLLSVSEIFDIIQKTKQGHEVITGKCVPIYDWDESAKDGEPPIAITAMIRASRKKIITETLTELYKKNELTKDCKIEVIIGDACRPGKVSFHAVVRRAGCFSCLKDVSLAGLVPEGGHWDRQIYKDEGKQQKFRMFGTTKDGEKSGLIKFPDNMEMNANNFAKTLASFVIGEKEHQRLARVPEANPSGSLSANGDYKSNLPGVNIHKSASIKKLLKIAGLYSRDAMRDLYDEWVKFVFAMKNIEEALNASGKKTKISLMALARKCSKLADENNDDGTKSKKVYFNEAFFVDKWNFGQSSGGHKVGLTWLRELAKENNPEEYEQWEEEHKSIRKTKKDKTSSQDEVKEHDLEPELFDSLVDSDERYDAPAKGTWVYYDHTWFSKNQHRIIPTKLLFEFFQETIFYCNNGGAPILYVKDERMDSNRTIEKYYNCIDPYSVFSSYCGGMKLSEDVKIKPKALFKYWVARNMYRNVVFHPYLDIDPVAKTPDFNIFLGFKYKYRKLSTNEYALCAERAKLLIGHIREMCGEQTEWVLDWIAHMFQEPTVRPKTTVVIKSPQGAGKDSMGDMICDLLGDSYHITYGALADYIAKFNLSSSNKLLSRLNEVSNFPTHAIADQMKCKQTEKTTLVEPKGKEKYNTINLSRQLIFTNNDHAFRAEPGDRRNLAIENIGSKCGDSEESKQYFKDLYADMKVHSEDFFLFLANRDISKFDPHSPAKMTDMKEKMIWEASPTSLHYIKAIAPFVDKRSQHPLCEDTYDDLYFRYVEWFTKTGEHGRPMSKRACIKDWSAIGLTVSRRTINGGRREYIEDKHYSKIEEGISKHLRIKFKFDVDADPHMSELDQGLN